MKRIDVVIVGHGGVSAVRAMYVICVVPTAFVGGAAGGVGFRGRDAVFVVVVIVGTVKVSVVQVAHMVPVLYGDVAAAGAVLVGVIFHLALAATLRLGIFPAAMLALYAAFFHPDELRAAWHRLRRRVPAAGGGNGGKHVAA